MVRIQIKGGVWKNTEDEILKAAVMKYGKTQWARISSLLVRKTPAQCKARWFEWLDPSIKKTEWTQNEEEKLLHLAKIMPSQWRTIAPIIGRTAAQCLEHYEKLLDAAQHKEGEYDPADDPRRLRPGEIDPLPEAKPARPDPIDMDEDEKEMLSEARARLANTKGKKAKRKAREKQMEEARRLASLQKKRELKAAGIEIKGHGVMKRKRKFGIDYATEVPFEHRAAAGFFDVSQEREMTRKAKDDPKFLNMDLADLDLKRRDKQEELERKKDEKRLKLAMEKKLPEALEQINRLNDPEMIRRRTRLDLPAPMVSDAELEEISKLGGGNSMVPFAGGSGATAALITSGTPMRTPAAAARTPASRTPMTRDVLLEEAQNLIALTNAQTPLMGGENASIHATDFGGITPRRTAAQTPNVLGTPAPGATPRRSELRPQTPGTPMRGAVRDELNINASEEGQSFAQGRKQQDAMRRKLASGLSSLPKPKNEYQLVLPDLPAEPVAPKKTHSMEEDAEDAANRVQKERSEEQLLEYKRRSTAAQRADDGIPRVALINWALPIPTGSSPEAGAARLIRDEVLLLLKNDAAIAPVGSNRKQAPPADFDTFPEEQLDQARKIVDLELEAMGMSEALIESQMEQFAEVSDTLRDDLLFLPAIKQFSFVSTAPKADQFTAVRQQFELLRARLDEQRDLAAKQLSKVSVLTQGLQTRAQTLNSQLIQTFLQYQESLGKLACFKQLQSVEEDVAIPNRIKNMKQETGRLATREATFQDRYKFLLAEKERLQDLLAGPQAATAMAQ